MTTVTIPKGFIVTPGQFDELADANTGIRLELTAQGVLLVMSPTGGTAGRRNFRLCQQLANWAERDETGVGFDSSTIFVLPNGARRSPDAAWIQLKRWNTLTQEEQDGFPPIAPDFVIELVSPSDLANQRYEDLQQKMPEYLDNGVRLGWLIEPKTQTVEIYRMGQPVEALQNPKSLSGEVVLPGLLLDLEPIWG
ncbi:MAG: Uma2 family endonuclease [Cyanophyceae cyanobacterium]